MTDPFHSDDAAELETATERLVEQVAALSGALQSIGDIQRDQMELRREVRAVKEDVQENAVPKHEFQIAQSQGAIARGKLQTRIRIFAISTACVAVLISSAAALLSYFAEKRAVDSERNSRLAVCEQRNRDAVEGAARAKVFFKPYLAQESRNPNADPVLTAILHAIADQPPVLLACRANWKVQPVPTPTHVVPSILLPSSLPPTKK